MDYWHITKGALTRSKHLVQTVAAIENTKSMLLCGFEMSVSAIQQYKIKEFRIRIRLKDYFIKVIICMSEFLI